SAQPGDVLCLNTSDGGGHLSACAFFFQAEDGIRDLIVTGVQTCALPICRRYRSSMSWWIDTGDSTMKCSGHAARGAQRIESEERSEERRVGKECRCGWAADD